MNDLFKEFPNKDDRYYLIDVLRCARNLIEKRQADYICNAIRDTTRWKDTWVQFLGEELIKEIRVRLDGCWTVRAWLKKRGYLSHYPQEWQDGWYTTESSRWHSASKFTEFCEAIRTYRLLWIDSLIRELTFD